MTAPQHATMPAWAVPPAGARPYGAPPPPTRPVWAPPPQPPRPPRPTQPPYGWSAPQPAWSNPMQGPGAATVLPPAPPFPAPVRFGGAPAWHPVGHGGLSTPKWWLLGALSVLTGIAIVVTLIAVTGVGGSDDRVASQSTSATGAPTPKTAAAIPVQALAGLLPDRTEFAAAAGTGPRAEWRRAEALYPDHIVGEDCLGAVGVAADAFFQGSGWTAARTESLVPPGDNDDRERGAWLGVVSFPDAAGATTMYAKTLATDKQCAGRSVNLRDPSDPSDYDRFSTVGQPTEADDIVTVSRTQEGGEGWGCQLGVMARTNVVITASVCGDDVSADVVRALIQSVAAKVSVQT